MKRIVTCVLAAAIGVAASSPATASPGKPSVVKAATGLDKPSTFESAPDTSDQPPVPVDAVKVQILTPVSKEEASKYPRCSATITVNCVQIRPRD